MSELVGISTPGGAVVSTVGIISAHHRAMCVQFAHVLLNDRLLVEKFQNKHSDVDEFVNAVVSKWLASGTGTWEDLLEAMARADMDRNGIRKIRDAIPLTGNVTR